MSGHDDDNEFNTGRGPSPIVTVDYDLYAHFLDDSDLNEEQKREFLQTLWTLICEMVALGFAVHPVQQAQSTCGKLEENRTNPPFLGADAVELKGQFLKLQFIDVAEGSTRKAAERD